MAGLGPGEQAEQHYLVQPRALAGGGDVRHVSEFLRTSGWRDKSRAGGLLFLESPDRTVRVTYDPYILPSGWTLHGGVNSPDGKWSAHLGRQTPAEIVAGLTTAPAPRPRRAPTTRAGPPTTVVAHTAPPRGQPDDTPHTPTSGRRDDNRYVTASIDAHIRLDTHTTHPSAVTAVLTGIQARLIHLHLEALEWAKAAAERLAAEGITVEITLGLQDAMDEERAWVGHPMTWCTRDEIRAISDEAQKIHDDIRHGRLRHPRVPDPAHRTRPRGTHARNGMDRRRLRHSRRRPGGREDGRRRHAAALRRRLDTHPGQSVDALVVPHRGRGRGVRRFHRPSRRASSHGRPRCRPFTLNLRARKAVQRSVGSPVGQTGDPTHHW